MPPSGKDHYTILGVLREASAEEIKRAYLEGAQKLHPDRNVAAGETELFLEIQQSFEVLSNPQRRAQYDATLPPETDAHPLLRHQVVFSRPSLVKIDEPQLIYALLEVAPRDEGEKISAPPLNVCLVLDRSSSMQGEKLDMAKAAAIQFLRSLRPQDVFSIVTYSDKAEVLIPAGEPAERLQQEARIQMLQTSGATEIFQGLQAAMGEIRRSLDAQRAHHIILLTDGHTYGDEKECLALAEQAAAQNIGITGMGIGNEWNDIFLDELASRTGGSSAYISKPKDIQQLLGNKFKALASIYAEEVTLEFRPQAGIRIIETFRLQPEGGPIARRDPWLLGPILQELPLNVLFEIEVQPEALKDGSATLLDGALKISMSTQTRPVPPVRLTMSREVEAEASSEPPPKEILLALSHMTLYRMQERAHGETEAGRYENAAKHLENIASHLHAQGRHQLAKTAALEAEHLERMHTWSESGRKEIKFGTRALLLASGRDSIL